MEPTKNKRLQELRNNNEVKGLKSFWAFRKVANKLRDLKEVFFAVGIVDAKDFVHSKYGHNAVAISDELLHPDDYGRYRRDHHHNNRRFVERR